MTETDDDVNQLLDEFRRISETERVEHVWKDGEYQGCSVTYAHPLVPEMKTVFHPYVPLTFVRVLRPGESPTVEPWPKLTREYFLQKGLTVPGERKRVH
jgi:hypothetical protein